MIRTKISQLKRKLGEVAEHRGRVRSRTQDRGVRRVALVGYTNAGKSSLLRALTRTEAHVEDRLFATLDTQSRETVINGDRFRFTDTVGFIRKLPHGLVASFRATLEEALDADVLLHVIDASHPSWEEQAEVVGEVLAAAGAGKGGRLIAVLNKADRLDDNERERVLRQAEAMGWEALLVSAITRDGLEELKRALNPTREGAPPIHGT
jgi:GTP-binding protein HflX